MSARDVIADALQNTPEGQSEWGHIGRAEQILDVLHSAGYAVVPVEATNAMNMKQIITPEDRMILLLQEIIDALTVCANQFKFYEEQHRAKNTPDDDAKADVNRALADSVRALIARIYGDPR